MAQDGLLSADELELRAQGHKGELPRQFSTLSTLAIAFLLTSAWIGYSATFPYPLWAGSGPYVFWGLIVATVACSIITAGLAELSSAYPSTGGQYHFAFMVSCEKTRASVAFVMGWLSVIAYCLFTASATIVCAQITAAIAGFWHEDYVATQWQVYLMYVLYQALATAVVVLLPKQLPKTEIMFFFISVSGCIVFFITVLAASPTKQPAKVVFTEVVNVTGWGDGVSFILAVGTCMYAYIATDGASHIAEELPNPGKGVPRTMMLSLTISAISVIPWTLAFMFSTNDLDAVASAQLPILEVYYQAMDNRSGATFFAVWLLVIYFGSVVSVVAATGRLTWAFARDNGLPCSPTLAKIHPKLQMPVNATIASSIAVGIYGVIYVGSTNAFNSFISMSILSLNVTYAIPQGIVLWRGRDKVLPSTRQFNLGKIIGPFCNIFCVLWVSLYTVLFCLPTFLPAEASDMNYVSVVVAGCALIIVVMWFTGKRKTFTGPVSFCLSPLDREKWY
ncbi:putative amino acid permease [Exophiala viscosa]|uniref:putative amino acid permease n=1 Tax=Exophiala viscosa TaxID=2486360 RepID=UPI0021923C79|nr:putative amino acid permease [Exophiala viscosa]